MNIISPLTLILSYLIFQCQMLKHPEAAYLGLELVALSKSLYEILQIHGLVSPLEAHWKAREKDILELPDAIHTCSPKQQQLLTAWLADLPRAFGSAIKFGGIYFKVRLASWLHIRAGSCFHHFAKPETHHVSFRLRSDQQDKLHKCFDNAACQFASIPFLGCI